MIVLFLLLLLAAESIFSVKLFWNKLILTLTWLFIGLHSATISISDLALAKLIPTMHGYQIYGVSSAESFNASFAVSSKESVGCWSDAEIRDLPYERYMDVPGGNTLDYCAMHCFNKVVLIVIRGFPLSRKTGRFQVLRSSGPHVLNNVQNVHVCRCDRRR